MVRLQGKYASSVTRTQTSSAAIDANTRGDLLMCSLHQLIYARITRQVLTHASCCTSSVEEHDSLCSIRCGYTVSSSDIIEIALDKALQKHVQHMPETMQSIDQIKQSSIALTLSSGAMLNRSLTPLLDVLRIAQPYS